MLDNSQRTETYKSYILCFVDRASRYIFVIKTNLIHYLSSVYFVNQTLHVLGVFVAGPTDSHLKSTTRTSCIYTAFLLMIGYKYA